MHTAYRESIHELVDGTIGSIRRAELQRHLADCRECRAWLADMEAIRDAAGSLDPLEPPDGVWLQIAGRLHQERIGLWLRCCSQILCNANLPCHTFGSKMLNERIPQQERNSIAAAGSWRISARL